MKFIYALTAAIMAAAPSAAAPLSSISSPVKVVNIGLPPSIPSVIKSVAFVDEDTSKTDEADVVRVVRDEQHSIHMSAPAVPADAVNLEIMPHHRPHASTTDDYLNALSAVPSKPRPHHGDSNQPPHGFHHMHHGGHMAMNNNSEDAPRRYHACLGNLKLDDMVTSWMQLPWTVRFVVWFSTCFGVSMLLVGTAAFLINLVRGPGSIRLEELDEESAEFANEKTPLSLSVSAE